MLKWISIAVALLGVGIAVYAAGTQGRDKPPSPPPAAPPSVNPFAHGIAASGSVEAASRNIAVGAPESALVLGVAAQVGDKVAKGQPLFVLDDRLLRAELVRAQAQRAAAEARVARLQAQPRAEQIPPAEARVREQETVLADLESQLARWQSVTDRRAIPEEEFQRRQFAVQAARARLEEARADLALLRAGAWQQDIAVAQAEAAQAAADIRALDIRLERLTVRSPIDGVVLKRNVEPGQLVTVTPTTLAAAPMVVGDTSVLRVRARVDEEDSPQLREGAAARARVRGIRAQEVPLRMVRIEPLAIPKQELTGTTIERVDTRVVEVIFEIARSADVRLYPGQLVDVFIDAGGGGADVENKNSGK